MRSASTDDDIRIASRRHQLCILDVCQSEALHPQTHPPLLKPPGWRPRLDLSKDSLAAEPGIE